ncbi:MAG: hypothetical protein ACYC3P_03175 [Bellilinea sp.]
MPTFLHANQVSFSELLGGNEASQLRQSAPGPLADDHNKVSACNKRTDALSAHKDSTASLGTMG